MTSEVDEEMNSSSKITDLEDKNLQHALETSKQETHLNPQDKEKMEQMELE